ncbi:MAG: poly(3-hydroxybutyrate) depolymerase [Betaproteobacteria bacterium HGW-Betaproteobacteria-4]|jgi:polyhydroxybutyrate depolymerase|nr:MAG: poly(3-hydroxybutyrate) depolymerase [Betaproteobacteria bacterium HGW-Betaproteobacteria-4]
MRHYIDMGLGAALASGSGVTMLATEISMQFILGVILLCSSLHGVAGEALTDGVRLAPGDYERHVTHQGLNRRYLVHVPRRDDPLKPAPLVLAFHGGGGHAEFVADEARYGLIGKADKEGFVVVFPNGYSRLPGGRFATWNAGGCCGAARDGNVDDVGFARAVVAAVRAQLPIDPERIFATGMSNGGMMSHRLACEAGDLFRAVASVAGTDATTSCSPSRAVSVLHIHARDDTHVLFNGGAGEGAFRDASKIMDFVSVPETMARWARRNRCGAAPTAVRAWPEAHCETYSGCADGVALQLCVTDDGGHSWPGAQRVRRGKSPASTALDANDTIWAFFRDAASR